METQTIKIMKFEKIKKYFYDDKNKLIRMEQEIKNKDTSEVIQKRKTEYDDFNFSL